MSISRICVAFIAVVIIAAAPSRCVKVGANSGSPVAFFEACDADGDQRWSLSEFRSCMRNAGLSEGLRTTASADGSSTPLGTSEVHSMMKLIDTDHDGYISQNEYVSMIEDTKASVSQRTVKLKNRFGKEETITMDELMRRSQEMGPGLSMDEGQTTQTKSATSSLDTIAKENPDVARFVGIAKVAHEELVQQGFASGKMIQARSLPMGGSINRSKDRSEAIYNQHGDFKLWLEFSIQQPKPNTRPTGSRGNDELEFYEVEVERNRSRYVRPHYALLHAWRLDSNGQRTGSELTIRPPRKRFWTAERHRFLVDVLNRLAVTIIVLTFGTFAWGVKHFSSRPSTADVEVDESSKGSSVSPSQPTSIIHS